MEIGRKAGFIVNIGGCVVKTIVLPDWSLQYIEFPAGQMKEYRAAILKQEELTLERVTKSRIYFSD